MRLVRLSTMVGVGIVLGIAVMAAFRDDAAIVVVRQGDPMLNDGQTALIVLEGDFVAEMVRVALEESEMPFEVDDVETEFQTAGVGVSGRATISIAGVTVRPRFSAVIQPTAAGDGTIEVQMARLRAAGANLPGSFENVAERVINAELREATRLEGYRVTDVEVGEDELLIYLEREV